MIELLKSATVDLTRFLEIHVPGLSENWWHEHVVERLTFQQQRLVEERGFRSLSQMDFAALLRVLDQNWYELNSALGLPREARTWIKEMQSVRNRWAHLTSEEVPASQVYRDADTLGRLLRVLGAGEATLDAVDAEMASAMTSLAGDAAENSSRDRRREIPPDEATSTSGALFKVGDLVALRSGPNTLLPILSVVSGGAERRYEVFQNNAVATFYESQLQARAETANERRVMSVEELRARLTAMRILSPSIADLLSLRLGRVHFIPYQYRPVLKLVRADRPRLLIADEVGVGKTIEAGLIIKELQARMDFNSVLIVCPKALVAEHKWFNEMKRFDESFAAIDGSSLRHCLRETHLEGEWPDRYAKAILPFSLFDSNFVFGGEGRRSGREGRRLGLVDLDPPPKFDLVIVDEAHHIRNPETYLHKGVRFLCDNAQAVVFLTATPVQLGSKDLFTLLNVLRPDVVMDRASFEQMAEPNPHINNAVRACRAAAADWREEARVHLDQVAKTEWGRLFVRESPAYQALRDELADRDLDEGDRVRITHEIEELYTFSSLINRTRRRDIGEFTTRKPVTVSVNFTADHKRLHDDVLELVAEILVFHHGERSVKFLMTTIRRQAASCLYGLTPLLGDILHRRFDRLEALEATDDETDVDLDFVDAIRERIAILLECAEGIDPHDPKLERFKEILAEKRTLANDKALVFSTFRHTLAYLAAHLARGAVRFGLIHGDVPDEERAETRRRFALPGDHSDALDVLLSSEVGCEGLDFQFCDCMINYDLPWNPMRIEQRIGRIDRYGQESEAVAIYNFITPGTVDADIYERCLWRIGVFEGAVGGNEEILGEITRKLHGIGESFDLTASERARQLQQLADNSIRQLREEQALEEKQSELFGLDLPMRSWQRDFEAAHSNWLSPAAIERCVTTYLNTRAANDTRHVLGDGPQKTLRLAQGDRNTLLRNYRAVPGTRDPLSRDWEKWLKGTRPTLRITFEQEVAAEDTECVHVSVVHPLVRQAAMDLEIRKPGYCSLEVDRADLPPGAHYFRLYLWRKHGIRRDEEIVGVAEHPDVEAALFDLLRSARDGDPAVLPTDAAFDALDVHHHRKWIEADANHTEESCRFVDHRVQSLTVSHRARVRLLEDQIARIDNDKVRIMREAELARADVDYDRRMAELEEAARGADIRATPILFGTVLVRGADRR